MEGAYGIPCAGVWKQERMRLVCPYQGTGRSLAAPGFNVLCLEPKARKLPGKVITPWIDRQGSLTRSLAGFSLEGHCCKGPRGRIEWMWAICRDYTGKDRRILTNSALKLILKRRKKNTHTWQYKIWHTHEWRKTYTWPSKKVLGKRKRIRRNCLKELCDLLSTLGEQ